VKKGFTLIEIIVVMVIIALLAGILVPALSRGRRKARYTSWVAIKHSNESDPDCIAYYTFEQGDGSKLINQAKASSETDFGGIYSPALLDGEIHGARWVAKGRFEEKPCLYFDGDDYVDCGKSVAFCITGKLTLEAWIKVENSGKIISKKKDSTTYFSLEISNDKPSGTVGSDAVTGSSAIDDGKWHHLVLTYDDGAIFLYCDGVQCDSGAASLSAGEGATVTIGSGFKGFIDEVAIYKKALTADEIKERYEKGKGIST